MNNVTYRHEIKFICSETELQLLEKRIKSVCSKDAHADSNAAYHIRSMYFDTFNDDCLRENEAGVNNRHKYRIRIYNFSNEVIKLERKGSLNGLKYKEDCTLSEEQCRRLLQGVPVEDILPEQSLLREFTLEKTCTLLKPCVIVDYTRTPYLYPIGNVRITFDRNISASYPNRDFFYKDIPTQSIMPEDIHILEVKYNEVLPGTILELINSGMNLQQTSFSKYALCREALLF